jgi:hypothetical protein
LICRNEHNMCRYPTYPNVLILRVDTLHASYTEEREACDTTPVGNHNAYRMTVRCTPTLQIDDTDADTYQHEMGADKEYNVWRDALAHSYTEHHPVLVEFMGKTYEGFISEFNTSPPQTQVIEVAFRTYTERIEKPKVFHITIKLTREIASPSMGALRNSCYA